jgi:sigma-B regulation protein RsbU (phosphoserine phosphatase)
MPAGGAIAADWRFLTSSSLGGDSFGYHWLAPDELAIYLMDVCGHGVGSALLSVSAINAVRGGTLPNTDFRRPADVLAALNNAFPMSERDGKYFTMWYGVYNTGTRELTFASGGHPPAIAVLPDGSARPLTTPGLIVGAMPGVSYREKTETLPEGTRLYVFSDGCYELTSPENRLMDLADFTESLKTPETGAGALDGIISRARAWQNREDFEDDFSLIEFTL